MAPETKQDVLDEIAALVRRRRWEVSNGSTELKDALLDIADALGVHVEQRMTKPQIGEAIAAAGGEMWDETCDSTDSPSGGGSTVTLEGLRRIRAAAQTILARGR